MISSVNLFYVGANLIIFKYLIRGHRELLEIMSLFKVKNTSVNSLRSAHFWLWFYLKHFYFKEKII